MPPRPSVRRLTVGELHMEQVEKIARPLTLVVCLVAFVVSYRQIVWAAQLVGITFPFSWMLPMLIDLPALTASALTVAMHDRPIRQRAYAWAVLIVFLGLSWFSNGLHALHYADRTLLPPYLAPYAAVIVTLLAGIPPIGAVLGPHLYAFILRNGVRAQETSDVTTTAPVRAPEPARERPTLRARAEKAATRAVRVEQARAHATRGAQPAVNLEKEARAPQPASTPEPAPAPAGARAAGDRQAREEAAFRIYRERRLDGRTMQGDEIARLINEGLSASQGRRIRAKWDSIIEAEDAPTAAPTLAPAVDETAA